MIISMVMGPIFSKMAKDMKDNYKKIKNTEKEFTTTRMETFIKAPGKTTKNTAKATSQ